MRTIPVFLPANNCFVSFRTASLLFTVLTFLLTPAFVRGASATWSATPTDGQWIATNTPVVENNWSTGASAWPGGNSTGNGDTATFNNSSTITTVIITNVQSIGTWNVKNITFDTASCAPYTITNASGVTARLTAGGAVTINSTVTQPQLFAGGQYRLHSGGGSSFVNNAATATATLTITAGIKANNSVNTITNDQAVNLSGSNTGSNVISGAIVDNASPSLGQYATVIKSGAGTWYLTAANTYTGPTAVSAGLLSLGSAGTINRSTNVLVSGGTLQFNAPMYLAAIATNGTAAPSALLISSGTLQITNTAYQTPVTISNFAVSGATLRVGVNGSTPFTNIVASSSLSVGPATAISIDQVVNVLTPTTFNLMSYAGADPSAANFSVAIASGYSVGSVTVDTVNKLVQVTVTPNTSIPSLVWVGALSGGTLDSAWNTTDQNWLNAAIYSAYADPDFVQFDDTASNNTVTLSATVLPTGIIVTNNTLNYTFSGPGKISGPLTKNGSGSLTLTETGGDNFTGTGLAVNNGLVVLDNTSGAMTGSTTIGSGATVQVGNNDAGGTLPSGPVSNNGTLIFSNSANITISSVISGSGSLQQNDTNTVTLSATNSSFTGSALVQQGTLKVNNFFALGATNASGGSVSIANGATLDLGGMVFTNIAGGFGVKPFTVSGAGMGGNGAIINSSTTGAQQQNAFQSITLTGNTTFGGPTRWDLRGGASSLDLAGFTVTKTGANEIACVSAHITGGNVIINQGTMSFESSLVFSGSGTITVNSGGTMGQYRVGPGTFTRPVTLNGGAIQLLSNTGTFATNDAPITLTANSTIIASSSSTYPFFMNGVISDGGAGYGFTKSNPGLLVLTASSTYSGNTLINAGTLVLNGAGAIGQSADINVAGGATFDVSAVLSPFTLNAGQTLSGAGVVTGAVTTASGALLAPGTNGIGTLLFTNSLTLDAASTNLFSVTSTGGASNKVAVAGTLTPNNSVIKITSGSPLQPGTYTLFTYGTISGTFNPAVVFDVAPVHPASIVDDGSGHINLVVPNQPPVATPLTIARMAGLNMVKIALANLATNWSDADGDTISFVSVGNSTNGVTVTTNSGFVVYNTTANVNDQFSYVITDSLGATNSGVVNIAVDNAGLFGQASPSITTTGGAPTMNFAGIPGYSYSVQVSTDLLNWTTIWTTNAPVTGLFDFTDNSAPQPSAYYRLEWNP